MGVQSKLGPCKREWADCSFSVPARHLAFTPLIRLLGTGRYAIHVTILSGFTHTLERLWMTVHPQILLTFLAALSRTRKIHLCVAESRAASLDSRRHPTASNLSLYNLRALKLYSSSQSNTSCLVKR